MGNPSVQKREKERQRQDRQKEKTAKRAERKAGTPDRVMVDGVDPDLVGIVAGPQPIPDEE